MPAKSKAQQKAAGAALAAKRGEQPKSKLKGASRQMVESMSETQLEEFASTKRKGLPRRVGSTATKAGDAKSRTAKSRTASARRRSGKS